MVRLVMRCRRGMGSLDPQMCEWVISDPDPEAGGVRTDASGGDGGGAGGAVGHFPDGFSRLAPYLLRPCLRLRVPAVSRVPRMTWYRTPGRSFTRPPRTSTTECSWRLCPIPGMYAVTSILEVRRTRHTLRSAELGLRGVTV